MNRRTLAPTWLILLPIATVLVVMAFTNSSAQKEVPSVRSQDPAKKKSENRKVPQLTQIPPFAELNHPDRHEDFPAMCLNEEGKPIVVYVEHSQGADQLKLAEFVKGKLKPVAVLSDETITNITQPSLARLQSGRHLCVWSQLEADGQWDLWGRLIGRRGKAALGKPFRLTESKGNDIFPDLGRDRHDRVWVTWQRLQNRVAQVMARHGSGDPVNWSETITVTEGAEGGDWEPRLAFGEKDEALIVFDSYRRGDFDLYLTRVSPDGLASDPFPLAQTDRYEARGEAATSLDGKTLWVAYEDGVVRWGKDLGSEWRQKGGGLHHDRQLKVLRIDLETNAIEKVADITALLPDLVADPKSVGTGAIDVPEVIVDLEDHPWVFFRYSLFNGPGNWRIAFSRLNPETGAWAKPETLAKSPYCLDRRSPIALDPNDGTLKVAYASDQRKGKQAGDCGVLLAKINPADQRHSIGPLPFDLLQEAPSLLEPHNDTPERDRDDSHFWEINGERYRLVWGDVHRHTDFSNCRTTDDGCITEHFRYAIEAGGLDFLGTSDHTEVGKTYTSYEWWQTQKMADLFHNPGHFVSLYAYEREQKYPYGHRNVIFLERGGPVIYIKRQNYERYTENALPLPPADGEILGDIPPWQLWDLLRAHGQRAITIEHTSAGRMGTSWHKYESLDTEFENVLEVFQGSRDSSEGEGAPQPPIVVGGPKASKFAGTLSTGTWQVALDLGHRLGAFASSDHRSTNVSYGGVYVKEFSREGIFDAIDARRTTAATDKIYMELSCNGHLIGETFETADALTLEINIHGTASISRVTLVRNEKDHQIWEPASHDIHFETTFQDETPETGEHRYYLRVEQLDGNMGWTSPVWVTVK
ncbi:MAG: hypothetical protein AAGA96_03740 [Verrucomicrobiota bacterium]